MPYIHHAPADIKTVEDLRKWVEDEFRAIARELAETLVLELRPMYREPVKPREGMIVSADGTEWNPGAGAGAYEYIGGVWVKL